ncbi:MAG: thiol-disulfide isomerase/thioredoxin [Paraglaciecola sp.]|jgi:thiol-disulfide isomerase/thioredoxin
MKSKFFFSKLLFAFFSLTIIISCGKDDQPDDGCSDLLNEYITYEYFNENSSPTISENSIGESNKVSNIDASAELINSGQQVLIRINGLRVKSNSANYEVKTFKIDENRGDCFREQTEFTFNADSIKTDIASVLVLDMSESLDTITPLLKEYAKKYAFEIANSSTNAKVAVIFFSDNDAIEETGFYDSSNVSELQDIIDAFVDYRPSTALFQATVDGINLINNLIFDGDKSVVVFTDGGENNSDYPVDLKAQIEAAPDNIGIYSIGLRGNDFNETDLKDIASSSSNTVIAETAADLEGFFEVVRKGVQSVYSISYKRGSQALSQSGAIKIRFNMETEKIE